MRPADIVFLVIGVIVVVVVGQLLAYSGRRYVGGGAATQRGGAGSIAVLSSVVFHLVTLGLLALIAVLPVGATPAQSVMLRIGILLLVLGAVYAATLGILSHKRQDAVAEAALSEKRQAQVPQQVPHEDSTPQGWPRHYDATHTQAYETEVPPRY